MDSWTTREVNSAVDKASAEQSGTREHQGAAQAAAAVDKAADWDPWEIQGPGPSRLDSSKNRGFPKYTYPIIYVC